MISFWQAKYSCKQGTDFNFVPDGLFMAWFLQPHALTVANLFLRGDNQLTITYININKNLSEQLAILSLALATVTL